MRYVLFVLAAALGLWALWYGQKDDAPGLGGIGLLVVVSATALLVPSVRRSRQGR